MLARLRQTLAVTRCWRGSCATLCLHAIQENSGYAYSVRARELRELLGAMLNSGYRFVKASEVTVEAPELRACVTFDDGYISVVEEAAPLLMDAGIPFTVFVASGLVSRNASFASWGQLRRLADSPLVEVGSHGVLHVDLRALSDRGVEEEVVHSQSELEQRLGRAVTLFAYPFGSYGERELSVVAKSYVAAFAVRPNGGDPRYELPRIDVRSANIEVVRKSLTNGLIRYIGRHYLL